MQELTILMRQEQIEVERDTTGLNSDSFLYYTNNGKLKVNTYKMAQKLINDFSIINIDNFLYSYNGQYYKKCEKEDIERAILRLHKDITMNELKEVLKKIQLGADKKKENLDYIALNNGVFNLETRKLEPYSKDIIVTKHMDIIYNDDVDIITGEPTGTNIKNYMMELVQNDYNLFCVLCEFLGQALYRKENILQKCLIIKGDKSNGKSKFLEILIKFFGTENVSTLDLKRFEQRFDLFSIVDKMVNIGDDISGQYIPDSSNIKKIITSEMLPIERKGQDLFDYKPRIICIFSCNNLPRFDDSTKAIKRRLCILPFNNTYSPELKNTKSFIVREMTTPENLSELFSWSVWGLDRVLRNHKLTDSPKIMELVEEFDRDNDPIRTFIEDMAGDTELDLKGYFNMKDTKAVYTDYQIWCNNNGYKEMNNTKFGKQLKQHIPGLNKERYRNNYKRNYRFIL